jgi:phosphatidylglycerophosphatase A
MSIKESSDELNPPIASSQQSIASARPVLSFKDYAALAISTCGVGYLPLAPGTWGSLLAVGFYLLLRTSFSWRVGVNQGLYSPTFLVAQILIIAVVTALGVWAASRTERVLQIKDPGKVVVDELAGQLIALVAVPLAVESRPSLMVITAFLLFRFFDIVKPYPARRLESLHGGLGIMSDDLVAGFYAALIVVIIVGFNLVSVGAN